MLVYFRMPVSSCLKAVCSSSKINVPPCCVSKPVFAGQRAPPAASVYHGRPAVVFIEPNAELMTIHKVAGMQCRSGNPQKCTDMQTDHFARHLAYVGAHVCSQMLHAAWCPAHYACMGSASVLGKEHRKLTGHASVGMTQGFCMLTVRGCRAKDSHRGKMLTM